MRCEVLGKFRMVRHVLLPAVCRASSSKGQQSSFLSCHTPTAEGLAIEAVTCCATNSCLPGHARLVTIGYEAPGTMYFLKDAHFGDGIRATLPVSVRREG